MYNTVADNIREVGSYECGDRVTEAFQQIEQLIVAGDDETLVEEFGICRPFNISKSPVCFSEGTQSKYWHIWHSKVLEWMSVCSRKELSNKLAHSLNDSSK